MVEVPSPPTNIEQLYITMTVCYYGGVVVKDAVCNSGERLLTFSLKASQIASLPSVRGIVDWNCLWLGPSHYGCFLFQVQGLCTNTSFF